MVCELLLNKANFKNFSLFAMLIRKSLLAHRKWKKKKKEQTRAFPGSPVIRTLCFPLQEAWVRSLVGELI